MGENGTKLSGGQRQRLAIARSIVKEPTILILDEATSAIDVRSERIVQAALDRVSKDRTTIVIAHRLSTIRKADHIVVMAGGVDMEQGTHERLLEWRNGLYSGLVNAQRLDLLAEDEEVDMTEATHELIEREPSSNIAPQKQAPDQEKEETDKNRGFFGSIGYLLSEQLAHWPIFLPGIIATAGAGCKHFRNLSCTMALADFRLKPLSHCKAGCLQNLFRYFNLLAKSLLMLPTSGP